MGIPKGTKWVVTLESRPLSESAWTPAPWSHFISPPLRVTVMPTWHPLRSVARIFPRKSPQKERTSAFRQVIGTVLEVLSFKRRKSLSHI